MYHGTRSDQRDVSSFPQNNGLTYLELKIALVNHGIVHSPRKPQIDWLVALRRRNSSLDGGRAVRRGKHYDIGHRPHDSNVLKAHVRRPKRPYCISGGQPDKLDRKSHVPHVDLYLIRATHGGKGRVRCGERDEPFLRESRRHSNHVLFRNPEIVEAVWELRLEPVKA